MSSQRLLRFAGLTALVSAVVSGIGDLLSLVVDLENPAVATSAPYALVFGLYLLGALLLLLGLVGLYLRQADPAGMLGLIGFLTAFLGTALLVGAVWFELFITPPLAAQAPELSEAELGLAGCILSFLLAGIGWLVFGVVTLRGGLPAGGRRAAHRQRGPLFRPDTISRHRPFYCRGMVRVHSVHGRTVAST